MKHTSESALDYYAVDYSPGTVLFREGDEGNEMYVIQSGVVEISRRIGDTDKILAVLPPGEFFGEMALVNRRPRSARATVAVASRLLVIEGPTFESMIRNKSEIAVRIIQTLARRLERANQQVELLLLRDANHRVVQCLRQLAEARRVEGQPGAVFIPITDSALAAKIALSTFEVIEVIERLTAAGLVVSASDAGIPGEGYVVPEVGRLLEFLEFLELKERYGALANE